LIGFIEKVDSNGSIELKFFDGEGTIEEDPSILSQDELTLIAFDSSYCLHYERYFRRMKKNQRASE
jgi:hypothetical protein